MGGASISLPRPSAFQLEGLLAVNTNLYSSLRVTPFADRLSAELKDSTAKPMNLLSRGKEPPHVTHRDSRTFRIITITTTWLVRTRPGSRVHSLSAPYTLLATHAPS